MKNLIISILVIILLYSISYGEDKYNNPKGIINKDILTSINWYYNPTLLCDDAYWIEFHKDNSFHIQGMHNPPYIIGKYEINNNIIRLKINNAEDKYKSLINKNINAIYSRDLQNYWFLDKIDIKDINYTFFALDSSSPIGKIYTLDNIEVKKLNDEKYITTGNVKFRSKPSTLSSTLRVGRYYLPNNKNKEMEGKDFFLKNSEIIIIGRSINKFKVSNYEDYWYYIIERNEVCASYGWVFGAFIKKK